MNVRGLYSKEMIARKIKKVQVGNDQEKAQSERNSHPKTRGGEKTKLTIRYLKPICKSTSRKHCPRFFSFRLYTTLNEFVVPKVDDGVLVVHMLRYNHTDI